MKEIAYTKRFRQDYKRIKKRGWDIKKLEAIVDTLSRGHSLPTDVRPHKLAGQFRDVWDIHITGDWVLLYETTEEVLVLRRTGTHADLF